MASMAPFGNFQIIILENEFEKKAVQSIIVATKKIRRIPITQRHHGKSRHKMQPWWLSESGSIIAKDYSEASKLCNIIDAKVEKMISSASKSTKRKIG